MFFGAIPSCAQDLLLTLHQRSLRVGLKDHMGWWGANLYWIHVKQTYTPCTNTLAPVLAFLTPISLSWGMAFWVATSSKPKSILKTQLEAHFFHISNLFHVSKLLVLPVSQHLSWLVPPLICTSQVLSHPFLSTEQPALCRPPSILRVVLSVSFKDWHNALLVGLFENNLLNMDGFDNWLGFISWLSHFCWSKMLGCSRPLSKSYH